MIICALVKHELMHFSSVQIILLIRLANFLQLSKSQ